MFIVHSAQFLARQFNKVQVLVVHRRKTYNELENLVVSHFELNLGEKIMRIILLAISMIVLSGCYQEGRSKTIVLKANGSVQVKPDEASASINIKCINKNIDVANECLVKESANLKTILVGLGIEEKDILTTQVNLNKSFVWRNNSNVFDGYNASTAVNVTLRDLAIISSFYTELLTHEKFIISSLTYHHSDYEELKKQAYLNALDNSNDLAKDILAKLPEASKEIIQVSNVEIKANNRPSSERKALQFSEVSNDSSNAGISVTVGNMVIEQTLFVEYRIF